MLANILFHSPSKNQNSFYANKNEICVLLTVGNIIKKKHPVYQIWAKILKIDIIYLTLHSGAWK